MGKTLGSSNWSYYYRSLPSTYIYKMGVLAATYSEIMSTCMYKSIPPPTKQLLGCVLKDHAFTQRAGNL